MKKELLFILAGLAIISLIATLMDNVGDVVSFGVLSIVFVAFFVGACLIDRYVLSIPTVADLEKRIMLKMDEEGYPCKKDEGVLVFKLNGREFRSYFQKTDQNAFRTAIVDFASIDEDWDKISMEGKAVLANYVNGECQHSTFYANEYGCFCTYTSFVRNPTDFLAETHIGYYTIKNAYTTAIEMLPSIKQQYTVDGHDGAIGFMSREKGL